MLMLIIINNNKYIFCFQHDNCMSVTIYYGICKIKLKIYVGHHYSILLRVYYYCRCYHGVEQFSVHIHSLFRLSCNRVVDRVWILSAIHRYTTNRLGMCTDIPSGSDRKPDKHPVGEDTVS